MNAEIAKAINDLSKRMTEMENKLESFLITKIKDGDAEVNNNISKVSSVIANDWDENITYDVDAYCNYNGTLWKCKVRHRDIEPTEGVFWESSSIVSELLEKADNTEE